MAFSNTVIALEGRAKSAGLTIKQLCARAKINRATWQRWKADVSEPGLSKWIAVCGVIERAENEAGKHKTPICHGRGAGA